MKYIVDADQSMKTKLSDHSEEGAFRGPFEATFTALGSLFVLIAIIPGLPILYFSGNKSLFLWAGIIGLVLIFTRIILFVLERLGKW